MKKDKQMDDKDLETAAGGGFSIMRDSMTPYSRTCSRCGRTYTVDPKLNQAPHSLICPKRNEPIAFSDLYKSKNS